MQALTGGASALALSGASNLRQLLTVARIAQVYVDIQTPAEVWDRLRSACEAYLGAHPEWALRMRTLPVPSPCQWPWSSCLHQSWQRRADRLCMLRHACSPPPAGTAVGTEAR